MTATEPQEQEEAPEPEEPSRLAGGCVIVVLVGAAGGVVYAVPEAGYFVAGLLTTGTVRKVRTWLAGRRESDAEEAEQGSTVDIVDQLRALAAGGEHVRLTQLQEATGLPDTKTVRALLDEAGIPVRPGVRAGGKNGPGVHQDDIPPAPLPGGAAPAERCLCRSEANANTNNAPEEGPREGFRVEAIGQAGTVVHDPAEAHRHHQVRAH